TLSITNYLSTPLHGLVITDALPAAAHYIVDDPSIPFTNGVLTWTAEMLDAGATTQRQFRVLSTETITNGDYGVRANNGVSATGNIPVTTYVGPTATLPSRIEQDGDTIVNDGAVITWVAHWPDGAIHSGALTSNPAFNYSPSLFLYMPLVINS